MSVAGYIMVSSTIPRKGIPMRVTATIDTRAAVRGEEPSQARELEVETATYEEGRDQLHTMVPDGWQMIGIGVQERADMYRKSH